MNHILKIIKEFREQIKSNSKLEIDTTNWNDIIDISDSSMGWTLEDLKTIANLEMEKKDAPILKLSGMKLIWESNTDDYTIYGGFYFNGIFEALANPSTFWKIDFSLSNDVPVPEHLKHFETLNWFEKQGRSDDWRYSCFKRETKKFPPKIVFFDKNWYCSINLSIEEYFEAMISSCAVKGWQYFFIDWNQNIPHKSIALDDMEIAIRVLPELFPEKDFSYHINIYNQVK